MKSILLLISYISFLQITRTTANLRLVNEWKALDFKFPDSISRQEAIDSGAFQPGNSFIIDSDVQYKSGGKSRVFVTVPRFDTGRPFTLGTVSRELSNGQYLIEPYPDISWHLNEGRNCDGFTSVLRVAIDKCSRLWILDTGKVGDEQICSPKIHAFDLFTDKPIISHEFTTAFRPGSLLVTPIVDARGPNCENTFVYIADITNYGMIVFDQSTQTSWRVIDKYLYPHPPYGTFNIAGETFELMDGIIGMALSPLRSNNDDRTLYFHALASASENIVKTSALRNSSIWSDGQFHPQYFTEFPDKRQSQAAAQAIDNDGIMYFGLVSQNAIACWNTATPYKQENIDIVAQDDVKLQFASGVKIVNNLKGGQELWVTTCRFQKIMTGTMNPDELNFRILAANVKDLIRNTKCAHPNRRETNFVPGGSSTTYGGSSYH